MWVLPTEDSRIIHQSRILHDKTGGAKGVSGRYHCRMAIVNRKTRHSYHILETCEAGIAEAHCIIRNDKRHAMKGLDPQHQGPVSQT